MTIQEIKKEFFAMRNGMLGDTLRKAGMPYAVIFGLNIPQLGEIARRAQEDTAERDALARELWADTKVRESRLLADARHRRGQRNDGLRPDTRGSRHTRLPAPPPTSLCRRPRIRGAGHLRPRSPTPQPRRIGLTPGEGSKRQLH